MFVNVFCYLCDLMISSSIMIVLVLFLSPSIDKRYGIKWRKFFWIVLSVRLLLPFHFSFGFLITLPNLSNIKTATGWSILLLVLLVWITGAVIYIRIQTLNFRNYQNKIMELSEEITDKTTLDIYYRIQKETGINKPVPIYRCSGICTPIVIGSFAPVMLLPDQHYEEDTLEIIFYHEFMHLKKHDGWYKLFMMFITGLYWFNPFIHIMTKSSYNDIELVCDSDVTLSMTNEQRARYSEVLLESIPHNKKSDLAFSTCFFGSIKMLKRRISNIFEHTEKKRGYSVFSLFILLFIVCDTLFSFRYTRADTLSTELSTSNQVQSISENSSATDDALSQNTNGDSSQYYVGVHPDNALKADTELTQKAKNTLFGRLNEDDKNFIKKQIRSAHWWIEYYLYYQSSSLSNPNSLAWNSIYYNAESYIGVTNKVARAGYTGEECMQYLQQIKEIVNNEYFSSDVDLAISAMQEAIDSHDIQKLYQFHQIIHDLDYWLINYPLGTMKSAPPDWHGIYVYFNVLKSYECVEKNIQ